MNLISNSMNKWWKISFAACALFMVTMFFEGAFTYTTRVDDEALIVGVVPMAIWLTARWLSIKE